jgi:hypothetical protein
MVIRLMPELIKLYLDEDTISRSLVQALRSRNVDLLTASEANLITIPDAEHLAFAAAQNRTLLHYITLDSRQSSPCFEFQSGR